MSEDMADGSAAKVVDLNFWREHGREPDDDHRGGGGGPPEGGAPTDEGPQPVWASDDQLALQLAGKLYGDWLYVSRWGEWLCWDGRCWQRDETLTVVTHVRETCRRAGHFLYHAEHPQKTLARTVTGGRVIFNVERLTRSDKRIGRSPDAFDADPWRLNTPGGIVDLRDGTLHGHDRDALMTQIAGAAPEGACPAWHRFLSDVTNGDHDYQDYLQRLVGYSLNGSTEEEIFAFLYGPSNTGKSKFIETIRLLHGSYAGGAPMQSFTATVGERHPTDLASFAGKRLITAVETDQGRRWDQQRMTMLTGRDQIEARFMRGDFFSYHPQFLLLFAGNHRPHFGAVHSAMRRRMHLLPFTHRPEKIDKRLIDRLKAELGGIMRWAVEGAVYWRKHGLQPPAIVLQATEQYFAEENDLLLWIDERCERQASATTLLGDIYADYSAWSKAAGERYALSKRTFSTALEDLGFKRWRHPQSRSAGFNGIVLKASNEERLI